MLRKTLRKWKKKITEQNTNAKDNNMDIISDIVCSPDLPLEHENLSSNNVSVHQEKTGNENRNIGNIIINGPQ